MEQITDTTGRVIASIAGFNPEYKQPPGTTRYVAIVDVGVGIEELVVDAIHARAAKQCVDAELKTEGLVGHIKRIVERY